MAKWLNGPVVYKVTLLILLHNKYIFYTIRLADLEVGTFFNKKHVGKCVPCDVGKPSPSLYLNVYTAWTIRTIVM